MRIIPEQEEKIMRAIRDAVTLDPIISLRQLQSALERQNLGHRNLEYIAKLRKRIHQSALAVVNAQTVQARIVEMRERFRLARAKLQRIAYWSPDPSSPDEKRPWHKDIIAAVKAITQLDLAMFNAEMDAGMFERQLGTFDLRARPLDPDTKRAMLAAMAHWEIVEPAQLTEAKTPGQDHATNPAPQT